VTIETDTNFDGWTRSQVEEYKHRCDNYKIFAEVLEKVLKKVAKKYAPLAIVQTRAKETASFAEKCQRKKNKYKDPVNQLTDLCGGRIIVHTVEQVKAVSAFIENHFEIDRENSIDVSQRLKPTEFGYRSVHYIISFKKGVFPTRDVDFELPPLLFDDKNFKNRRAEIQVRTILEHAWADTAHELAYKSSFQIPAKWEREFAGVAAMLEGADKTFSRINEGLRTYATSYGSYMTEDQMHKEIKLLELVLEYDESNIELAGRIGKLAITLGDWDKAIEVLSAYEDMGETAILRDLGVALCKRYKDKPKSRKYKLGQRYLEEASKPPHEDIDALASLAGTYKLTDEDKARELYRRAFQLDPSDPYPLENYLDFEISLARDTSIISLLSPVISAAVERCNAQAEVGVNLPWAFYMIGKFSLMLDKPYKSLEAYAKAIQLSPASWMIDTALNSLERLKDVSSDLLGHEWARLLLIIGKAVMADKEAKEKAIEAEEAAFENEKAEILRKARNAARVAKEALNQVKELSSTGAKPIRAPVVIVAGGCDPSVEKQMKDYKQLVLTAFSDYKGTIISGGTEEGISGLVGSLAREYPESIDTIGYIPSYVPADAHVDKRYKEIRQTAGSGFSPLEPLQNWIDLIADGLKPSEVKVVGINGGLISAIEYRVALALGATVGIVEESGREAAMLFNDEKWANLSRLIHLPADNMTVRAFIGSGRPKLDKEIREELAKEIHKAYRQTKEKIVKTDDPAMTDWNNLPEGLKESNAQQADHIFEKLNHIGCTVRKSSVQKIEPFKFTEDEIELLSEIEHGRWNAERLLDGWTWGEKKDISQKESPYLAKWAELPEEVKEWDRATVRKIPDFLASIGLEIDRKT